MQAFAYLSVLFLTTNIPLMDINLMFAEYLLQAGIVLILVHILTLVLAQPILDKCCLHIMGKEMEASRNSIIPCAHKTVCGNWFNN